MSDKYYVKDGSVSGHCCFTHTVMRGEDGEIICETFSEVDAEMLVKLLNGVCDEN